MRHTVRYVVCLATLLALAPLASFAQTATLNLPAQPLAESLKALGAQANVNVMVSTALVDGKQAPALKAKLSVGDALAQLLNGTGLEYHFVNDQTVVIREKSAVVAKSDPPAGQPAPTNPQDNQKEAGKSSSQDFRVAQVDQTNAGPQIANGNEQQPQKRIELEEVVVTGSHIAGAQDSASPLQVFSADDIARSGQPTIAAFIKLCPKTSAALPNLV